MEKCCGEGEGLALSSGVPGCQASTGQAGSLIKAQILSKAGETVEGTLSLVTKTQGKLKQFRQNCSTEFHRIRKGNIDSVEN